MKNEKEKVNEQASDLLSEAEIRDIEKMEEQIKYQISLELEGYFL